MKYIEITKQEAEKVYKHDQIHISVYKANEDKGTVEFVKSYDVSRPKNISWAPTSTYEGKIDIDNNTNGSIMFDLDGKRYVYYNAIIEVIEK